MSELKNWGEYKAQLVEGLSPAQAKVVSVLLENTHKENITDRNVHNNVLVEATDATNTGTGNITRYDTMFAPLVRRTTPALLAMELVGVQPQSTPRGIVRTLRLRYAQTTNATSGGAAVVTVDDEASGVNVYKKYSQLAFGGDYDEVDLLNPFEQTLYLESNRGKPMDLEVVTRSAEVQSRKLSATYTLEAADDLASLDGLDLESEMTAGVGDEILRDLDRELIDKLNALAGTVEAFDFALVDGRYAGEKLSALSIAIDNLSSQIAIKTKKAGATWMVVSQRVFTGLKHAANGAFVPAVGQPTISTSLFVGTFAGNVRVYVDPYATVDSVLLGYKGASVMDTGLIYAPYIPLSSSGVVPIPDTGDSRIMLRTRYALHAATDSTNSLGDAPDYYARASVANISLGFVN
jgi:hypothetical protein